MSIGRWMDKKVVVHKHKGILLSYKKEHIWIGSNEVDETGAYYIELSKTERKRPIQYISTHIWNLERWKLWPYIWDSIRDTDMKNTLLDSVGEDEGGMIWENSIETCILPLWNRSPVQVQCMKQDTQSWCTGTTQRDGMGRGLWDGGHMYTRGWFMSMYGKNHHNIVKQLASN